MDKYQSIISAIVVLAVNGFGAFGIAVEPDTLTQILTGLAMLAATVWSIWRNHNFTDAANAAQSVLDDLKGKR